MGKTYDQIDSLVPINESKTCKTTNDSNAFESYYTKEFQWNNIHNDEMNSMFTNSGVAASENGNKRVLLYLGAARRILEVETWPPCTVQKCKFTNDQLKNDKVHSSSSFSTSNLTTNPKYASGFRFECTYQITKIRVKFTDLDTEHTVYPRMSIPVTNYVKVWDSYCKTALNNGHASRAYIVGNDPPEGTNSNHHVYNTRDYNGIRCDSIGGFHRYSNNADNPAYIAVFFGFRIRVCNFFVSMPDKAPANLALFMDGNEIAKVTSDAPDKVSDLLDWYKGTKEPNDLVGSSFKLVWPCVDYGNGNWTVAHLTRITISYTETGSPIRHWKSTLMNSNKYDHSCKWWVHQTEHPKVQGQNLGWKHTKAKKYTEDTLCKPGIRWKPLDGATAGYTNFSTNYDTEYAQRSGALFFYLAKEDVEVNLTAFIINFPDYGEKVDSNDNLTKYRKRSRNSGMKLISQSGSNFQTERVIAEFPKGQIAGSRLNLLDYRNTNYLSKIKSLKLVLEIKDVQDVHENVINSVDIFYFFNEFTPQKVWESTNRLKNSPVALPSYIGVKDEAMLAVDDTNRYHGHTKQMMTEGFPHYWHARDSTDRRVKIEFNGEIVMTSFIFETCRVYRRNNYRKVKLECWVKSDTGGAYQVICETPEKVGKRPKSNISSGVNPDTAASWSTTEELWSPGDHIEMFDHKKTKHMPFLTGKKFRLSFPDSGEVAVGKISVGYYDVNDESRDSKWIPGEFDKARITHPSNDSYLQQLNSNCFTFWTETSTNPYLEVKFLEKVRVKNVILGIDVKKTGSDYYPSAELDAYGRSQPNLSTNYYKNIQLKIDNSNIASTNNSFVPGDNQTHIHFFEYTNNENGFQDSSVYRNGVTYRNASNGSYDGQIVKLEWGNNSGGNVTCRMATLEIIYSKIVPSNLELAERACLAAHNNYRFRHGLAIDYNYYLGTDSLMASARAYAEKLVTDDLWEHSSDANMGVCGENLFRITWPNDTTPSEFDKLALAGEAVKQWYDEYVNYDTEDGGRNGNILHDGQIGHFLQVICKGSTSNGKIGVGIYSEGSITIVCVQYEKKASSMSKTADYIKYPTYIGAESLLTVHEEKELRKKIASGNANNVFKTCQFYLDKAKTKLDYMKLEAQDEFTKIIENGYSKAEWTSEINRIQNLVTSAKTRTSSQLSALKTDISAIVIPQSLAETRFRDLKLTGFFMEAIDCLGLTILVNGHTPMQSIIGNQTINEIITNDGPFGFGDHYNDNSVVWENFANTCPTDERPRAMKCIRVMLGLFGVQADTPAANVWYENNDAFKKAWERLTRRLKWVFDNDHKAPSAILEGYNALKGDGFDMTPVSYAETCTQEKHGSQTIEIQYDIIENQEN